MSENDDRHDKNAVFSARQAQQSVQSPTPSLRDEVPVEVVPLPSCGLLYPSNHPFHNLDRVEVASMTAKEEDLLTSAALIKKGTVITELIRSCLIDRRVDPDSLLSGDRNSLITAIRIMGYGADYEASVKCSECDALTKRTFNLSALPIKRLELTPSVPFENSFEFVLPRSGKRVQFRFMTGAGESEVNTHNEKQKKVYGHQKDVHVTAALTYAIISIDGDTDRARIARFVSVMPAGDSQALRKYMRENEPGVVMRQESKCVACGNEEEVAIELNSTFLWPNTAG